MFTDQALTENESLKTFQSADDLGKAYLDLHGKMAAGDMSVISEDIRKDPSLTFKNVNDLAKGYIETKKLVGGIKHAPGKPEEYKFTQFKDLHPGLKTEGMQKFLANELHSLDIDNDRADKLQSTIITALDKGLKANDEAKKVKSLETETALRGEWKGEYDKNRDNVEKILTKAGFGDMAKSMANDPMQLKAMHQITSLLSEDGIGKLGGAGDQNITEKTAAQKRLNEMVVNKEHLDKEGKWKTGPEYDKFNEEWQKMNALAGAA